MPKPGDIVVITGEGSGSLYHVGDHAKLVSQYSPGWWANFKNRGNSAVVGDGNWCIGYEGGRVFSFEVVKHA